MTAVPGHRPWARREDATEVETRYRRSQRYWDRQPRPDWDVVGSRTIQVTAVGANTTELTGPAGPITAACRLVGAPYARSTKGRGAWLVRSTEVGAVLSALQRRGFTVDEVLW